jgi:hypothetical protein
MNSGARKEQEKKRIKKRIDASRANTISQGAIENEITERGLGNPIWSFFNPRIA